VRKQPRPHSLGIPALFLPYARGPETKFARSAGVPRQRHPLLCVPGAAVPARGLAAHVAAPRQHHLAGDRCRWAGALAVLRGNGPHAGGTGDAMKHHLWKLPGFLFVIVQSYFSCCFVYVILLVGE